MQKKTKSKTFPRISQAEWEVMKAIWPKYPVSAADIVERLQKDEDWHPKTVKTLLGRLVKKGALDYYQEGRAYIYSPTVNEKECVRVESESFLERFFAGGLKPMLAHFVENKKISSSELQELKRILDEKSKK